MRKFRKRAKYTWMPTFGGLAQSGTDKYNTSYIQGAIAANGASQGPTDLYVTPIVPDATQFVLNAGSDAAGKGPTLRDFTEGQDWFLKRIVGKLVISVRQVDALVDVSPRTIIVGAGFFVGRADDANQDVPDTNNSEIDPFHADNIRQPWIWRRTWVLQNSLAIAEPGDDGVFPQNNEIYFGSSLDGPHIDAKTARRIRREERLWFVLNAYGMTALDIENDATWTQPGIVRFLLDYRILGAMRKSTNRSTF